MSDADLQKTIRALEKYLDPSCHVFDMTNVRNAITFLKNQQERIAELEDKIRADRTKATKVRAFAAWRLSEEENPEYPYTKKELRKALQHTIDALRHIAADKVLQEIENE